MEAKESLIDIARELNLNNILEDATLSQSEILLAILKRKNSDIDWPEMKYGASNVIETLCSETRPNAKPETVMCYAIGHRITTRQFVTFDIKPPFMHFKILTLAL